MEESQPTACSTSASPLFRHGLISSRRAPCGPLLPVPPAPQRLVPADVKAGITLLQTHTDVCCCFMPSHAVPSHLHLCSLRLGCPGSRINLFQPHLHLRGTHRHRRPLNVLHLFPQSHAILGFPLPHRLLGQCWNPRRKARHLVPKTAT